MLIYVGCSTNFKCANIKDQISSVCHMNEYNVRLSRHIHSGAPRQCVAPLNLRPDQAKITTNIANLIYNVNFVIHIRTSLSSTSSAENNGSIRSSSSSAKIAIATVISLQICFIHHTTFYHEWNGTIFGRWWSLRFAVIPLNPKQFQSQTTILLI